MEAVDMFIKNSTHEGAFKVDPDAIFAKETYIVVWKYLSMMYEGESSNEIGRNPFNNNEYQNDEIWNALKNVLLPNIAAYKITLDQLKSTFDGKFKKFRGYDDRFRDPWCLLSLRDSDSNGVHCSSSGQNITFIGTDHLCFKVRNQKVAFSPDHNGYRMDTTVELSDDSLKGLYERNPLLTMDFSGGWTPPDLTIGRKSNEIIEYKFGQIISIHITPPTVLKSMANKNGKRVCSNEYTLTECFDECRIQLIRKMCGCLPATLPTRYEDKTNELCTFEKYEKCLNYMGYEESECKAQCVPNCEQRNYEFNVELAPSMWSTSIAQFSFDSSLSFVYTEIPNWSFEEFLIALGGALGLYLGLYAVILIRFVLDPFFMLVRRCFAPKNAAVGPETRSAQEINREKSCFEKIRKFIKKSIATEDTSSPWVFITYLIEKLIWIVLYAAGGILTAYFCYRLSLTLWQQYEEQPVSSHIILMNNKTIALPKPTLCMDHYGKLTEKLNQLANFDNNISYTSSLTEYFNHGNMTRSLLLSESKWPSPLVMIASTYLGIMNMAEASGVSPAITTPELIEYYNIPWTYEFFLDRLSDSTQDDMKYAMEHVFEPSLKRLDVSIDEVRFKLGREIAKLADLKVNFVNADLTAISLINGIKLTVFGNWQSCFQLPFDAIYYSDASEYIEVSIGEPSFFTPYDGGFYMDFDAHLTGFDASASSKDAGRLLIKTSPGENVILSMGISAHYKMFSSRYGNGKCTAAIEACHATCRISLIQKLCNCTPTTWPTLLTSDTNLCTLSEYNQCLNYRMLDDIECRDECAEPCERYDFFHEETTMRDETTWTHSGAATLRVYVKDFAYLLFEDRPFQWSFLDFLTSLGCMLHLWLGLNIYTVVNIVIIIPISFLVGLCANNNIKQNSSTPRTKSENRAGVTSTSTEKIFCQVFNMDKQNLAKILTAKWITKSILSTACYLIGIFLTYQMCADIIRQYITEIESSYIFTRNDTINFKSYPTVCLPHSITHDLESVNQTAGDNYDEEMIQLLHDFITNSNSLLHGDMIWSKSLLRTAVSFIAFCGKYGRGERYQQVRESDYRPSVSISQLQLFEDILVHLDATGVSINDLMQKCGREVRKADIITARLNQPDYDLLQNIEISETTYIDEAAICYRLPFKEFRSLSEYIEVNVNLNRFGIDENYWSEVMEQVYDYWGPTADSITTYSMIPLSFSMRLGENVSAELKIKAEYNSLSVLNGVQRCSDAFSQEDCKINCKFQAVRELCSCLPLSLSDTASEILKHCSMEEYKTCLPFAHNVARECISKCLRPCKRIRFSEKKTLINRIEPNQASLRIRMTSFNFPVASERPAQTLSKFREKISGALLLWISLDGLVIVDALYTIVGVIFRLCSMFWRFVQER